MTMSSYIELHSTTDIGKDKIERREIFVGGSGGKRLRNLDVDWRIILEWILMK
jgi:hypothetical protein